MEQSSFKNNAVFFIETEKIKPNPFQPRRDFDENRLNDLADSIRMYGILQPLVVTRREIIKDDGGISTEYELIAGERRLRASRIAGLKEVPALIRTAEDDDRTKLELAIIENLQREDLNAIDRALAFQQLIEKFKFTHSEVGKKIGKSREYVSNSVRLLQLPEEIKISLSKGQISEGHTRPILMLSDRPEEQMVLFKEILLRKLTVRDAEKISRRVAYDKVRRKDRMFDPDIVEMEEEVSEKLGTRVHIEPKEVGGKIQIDYFDEEGLKKIMEFLRGEKGDPQAVRDELVKNYFGDDKNNQENLENGDPIQNSSEKEKVENPSDMNQETSDDDLYSLKDFTL